MKYSAENFVIKINIEATGETLSMEVYEYQQDFLKMRGQNDGTVVELKR